MKLTKAQQTVLNAVAAAVKAANGESVAQGSISVYMPNQRLPHPNTLQALTAKEFLSQDSAKGYYAYWVSSYGKDFIN